MGLLQTIILNLRKDMNNKQIKLFWTRAYIGNLGNESADDMAKEAILRDKIDLNCHPNKRHTKRSLHNKYLELWQRCWGNHVKGRNVYH